MKKLDISKTTWCDRFGKAYKAKWKDLGKSQKMFADEVNKIRTRGENGTIGTVSGQQVSKWLHGSIPEEENFKAICEVLGLDKEYFSPTRSEIYRDSSKYITELGKEHARFSEEIGLDLNLVKTIHDLVDFGEAFPLYTPICFDRPQVNYFKDEVTVRVGRGEAFWDHMESAPINRDEELDLDLDFLQFIRDGKRITLHKGDLAFLREVQDQVIEFVEYLFYKRSREMEEEVREVEERVKATVKVETTDRGTNYSFGVINTRDIITDVDRFAKYSIVFTDEEGGQDHGND